MAVPIEIPICRPIWTGQESDYVKRALDSGWISSNGEFVKRFESAFAVFAGCAHGVACSSGTSAIQLALTAIGIQPGDRVAVPSFTMMGSVFPILERGAEPVFIDCDNETWTMSRASLERAEGPIKAVIPVHIYGHPADMGVVSDWAKDHGAYVVEDAAEAHGAQVHGRPVGSLGHAAAFSFYANKIVTTGEGGMVTTNDETLAEQARHFRNMCFDANPARRFIHEQVGYNFRLTNLQAAVGLAQTESAARLVEMRRTMAGKYLGRLERFADYVQLPVERPGYKNVYWMFGILLRPSVRRNVEEVRQRLLDTGIETRRFFYPGHLQPFLRERNLCVDAPVSETLWEHGLCLPSPGDLTDEEADRVVDALKKIILS